MNECFPDASPLKNKRSCLNFFYAWLKGAADKNQRFKRMPYLPLENLVCEALESNQDGQILTAGGDVEKNFDGHCYDLDRDFGFRYNALDQEGWRKGLPKLNTKKMKKQNKAALKIDSRREEQARKLKFKKDLDVARMEAYKSIGDLNRSQSEEPWGTILKQIAIAKRSNTPDTKIDSELFKRWKSVVRVHDKSKIIELWKIFDGFETVEKVQEIVDNLE